MSLELDDDTNTQSVTESIYGVSQITDDAWGWNRQDGSGDFGLSVNSSVVNQLSMFSQSAVILETGPVTD